MVATNKSNNKSITSKQDELQSSIDKLNKIIDKLNEQVISYSSQLPDSYYFSQRLKAKPNPADMALKKLKEQGDPGTDF